MCHGWGGSGGEGSGLLVIMGMMEMLGNVEVLLEPS